MNFFKTAQKGRKSDAPVHARQETLRQQRLAHEETQKAAGLWGDMSVGLVRWNNDVFVHCWKGRQELDLAKIQENRGQDRTPEEHQRLTAWLIKHRSKGFEQRLLGWNLSLAEANRIKSSRIAEHRAGGRTVLNEQARVPAPAVA